MRSIEQLWCPQIHYVIQKYYSARAKMVGQDAVYECCSGYLSIYLTGAPKAGGKVPPKLGDGSDGESGGQKWKGKDIVCRCEPSWFWQGVVGLKVWGNSIRWDLYLPFVVNF